MEATRLLRPKSRELTIARQLVPAPPAGRYDAQTLHPNGYTSDIIESMLARFNATWRQVARLAPLLRGASEEDTFRNVWQFARRQITYVLDQPAGTQYIKTPAAVIQTGFADCKGLAILQNALLACLGYRPQFKFAGYASPQGEPTHVYSVVDDKAGRRFTLDACLYAFNIEKKPAMSKLVPALRS